MKQFLESIRIEHGAFQHLELHQRRADRTTQHFFGTHIDLLGLAVPAACSEGLHKCRVVYDTQIRSVEFHVYTPRPRHTVRLVYDDEACYTYKSTDRAFIDRWMAAAGTDDVIIVRGGWLTDSAIANLVFENSEGLFTPSRPLLAGVERQRLIEAGAVRLADIAPAQLPRYRWVHFVNAMQPLGSRPPFAVNRIF